MEMTFDIDPTLMRQARDEAARRGISVSDLMAAGLARMLEVEAAETKAPAPRVAEEEMNEELPPLPTWRGGEFLVDIANREALDPAMVDDDKDAPLPPLPTWKSGGFVADVADRKALYALLDGE